MHIIIISLNTIALSSALFVLIYAIKTIKKSKKELNAYRKKLRENRHKFDSNSKELNENGDHFR